MRASERIISRRLVLAGFGGAALGLTGCGGDDDEPAAAASDTRTVEGGLGSIQVPATPTRVESVGQYRDTDAAVALGVVPLLSPDLSTFIDGGVAPWVKDKLGGAALNVVDVEEMPYEKIVALRPELILATDRLKLEGEYPRLSKIAPTLSWDEGYNLDDWRTTTTRIGTALGKTHEAATLVKATEEAITKAKNENPAFAGKTFTLGPVTPDGTVNTINSTKDASAEFLGQLGLRLSPTVTSLKSTAIPGRSAISPERLDLIDADVVMLTFNTPDVRKRLEANPLFQSIPAVKEGRYVALDLPAALAIGFPSALSINYGLAQIVPKLRTVLA